MNRIFSFAMLLALPLFAPAARAAKSDPPAEWKLVFSDDFESGKADAWEPADAALWKTMKDGARGVYALVDKKGKYKPPVRSPENISLAKGTDVSDFVLEVKLRSTIKDYDHRDMVLVFGHQDPSHFYYVHFALKSDAHANSIFLVNDAPRVSIAKTRTEGTRWSEDYHTIRVVRRAAEGAIEVYFDDMEKPVFTAEDKTFAHGRIGVGSFDDTGNIDEVKLWGVPHAGGK